LPFLKISNNSLLRLTTNDPALFCIPLILERI
jgi:hypothetical protein